MGYQFDIATSFFCPTNPYYINTMKLLRILVFLSFATATVTDIDGNVYETVLIGEQLWME